MDEIWINWVDGRMPTAAEARALVLKAKEARLVAFRDMIVRGIQSAIKEERYHYMFTTEQNIWTREELHRVLNPLTLAPYYYILRVTEIGKWLFQVVLKWAPTDEKEQ